MEETGTGGTSRNPSSRAWISQGSRAPSRVWRTSFGKPGLGTTRKRQSEKSLWTSFHLGRWGRESEPRSQESSVPGGEAAFQARRVSTVQEIPPRRISSSEISTPSIPWKARRAISNLSRGEAPCPFSLRGDRAAGITTTWSWPPFSRAARAMARWPWWGGSKEPPKRQTFIAPLPRTRPGLLPSRRGGGPPARGPPGRPPPRLCPGPGPSRPPVFSPPLPAGGRRGTFPWRPA